MAEIKRRSWTDRTFSVPQKIEHGAHDDEDGYGFPLTTIGVGGDGTELEDFVREAKAEGMSYSEMAAQLMDDPWFGKFFRKGKNSVKDVEKLVFRIANRGIRNWDGNQQSLSAMFESVYKRAN
jgi:hypothetical protein